MAGENLLQESNVQPVLAFVTVGSDIYGKKNEQFIHES